MDWEYYVPRGPSSKTYIRTVLNHDLTLPDDSPYKMTHEQRLEYVRLLAKVPANGVPKGTKPSHTGKVKKPSRNLTDEDIKRLRGGDKKPKTAPKTEGTLNDFLTAVEEPKTDAPNA